MHALCQWRLPWLAVLLLLWRWLRLLCHPLLSLLLLLLLLRLLLRLRVLL